MRAVPDADPTEGEAGRPARRTRTTTPEAWADFQRLWSSHTISIFGDQLTLVALPLATYAETESALAVGIVTSMQAAATVVLGLVAGAVADRSRRRRVLLATDLARGAVLVALALALLAPAGAFAALLVAAAALAVLSLVHDVTATAVLPLVVDRRDLVTANARMDGAEAAGTAVGPAIAGGLIAVGSASLAFAADAATFVVSAVAVGRIRRLDAHDPPPQDRSSRPPIRAGIAAGIRALLDDRLMLRALVMMVAVNVVAMTIEAQFIPYAHEELGIGSFGIGLYFALGGSVAVLTSILAGRSTAARGDLIVVGVAVFAAGVLVAGIWPSLLTAGIAYVAGGFGSFLSSVQYVTLRHRRFPVTLQSRVASASRMLVFAAMPVVYLGGGAIASAVGPANLFVVAALVSGAMATWAAATGLLTLREE
jgi:hypothetical protein